MFEFEESDNYILEDVALHDHTLRFKYFTRNQPKNELYRHMTPGSGKLDGDVVNCEERLNSATLFSHQIGKTFYSKQGPAGGAVVNTRSKEHHLHRACVPDSQ